VIQRPDKVSLSASSGNQVTVTSTGANASSQPLQAYDWDVLVQVSTDGLPSEPFPMSVNAPWAVFGNHISDENESPQGYISTYSYILYDVAGFPISIPITLHETLENCQINFLQTTWCDTPLAPSTWGPNGPYFGTSDSPPQWEDHYFIYGIAYYPSPQDPQPGPLGMTAVVNLTQKWWIGAFGDLSKSPSNVFSGMCVEANKVQSYQDHGQAQKVTTPIAPGGNGGNLVVTGIPPLCAQGQFVNP
jgi:hypothetical protein